jgi:endonuclease III
VYALLKKEFGKHAMPVVDLISVQTGDPFKVLVSTILSARTKDAVTTAASQRLFSVVKSWDDLAALSPQEIEKLIYPVGFYKTKAKHLSLLPGELLKQFNGRIPHTVEELVLLPGVGRKTANLVVSVGFNIPAMCVDVHVHRICNRLGYVWTRTPLETEMRLREIVPVRFWTTFNSILVSFGQHRCFPVNPRCAGCPVYSYCNRVNVTTKFGA